MLPLDEFFSALPTAFMMAPSTRYIHIRMYQWLCLYLLFVVLNGQQIDNNIGSSRITCTDPVSCTLQCNGNNSCKRGTYRCKNTPICHIQCQNSTDEGCNNLNIEIISTSIPTQTTIICNSTNCPKLTINATSTVNSSSASLICQSSHCGNSNFYCDLYNGHCDASCSNDSICTVKSNLFLQSSSI